jgi:DNA (cytosine-5)-methyltransferase 1
MPLAIEHQSYNITFNDANGTRKDRPNGGCYINEVTTSNAITCGGVGDTRIVECIPIDMCTAPRVSANGKGFGEDGYPMYTLTTSNVHAVHTVQHTPCDLYNTSVYGTREVTAPVSKGNGECWENDKTFTSLTSGGGQMGQGYAAVRIESKVRRLTPLECERLQGFPDDWTEIAYKKKEAKDCPTSPRYKALGNSMAVPVMRFIGLGILEVENKK